MSHTPNVGQVLNWVNYVGVATKPLGMNTYYPVVLLAPPPRHPFSPFLVCVVVLDWKFRGMRPTPTLTDLSILSIAGYPL